MRLLVDCTPLSVGGGLQAALGLLNHAVEDNLEVYVAMSKQFENSIPSSVLTRLSGRFTFEKTSVIDMIWIGRQLSKIESKIQPDLVFVVFGPAYWRPKTVAVQGFALARLLYPEERRNYESRKRLVQWVKELVLARMTRRIKHLVVETEVARARLQALLHIDARKIYVIGNAANPIIVRSLRDSQPSENSGLCVLYPSAYYAHKNMEVLPEVASLLHGYLPVDNFKFVLTISPHSTPGRRLLAEATALQVERHLSLIGSVSLPDLAKWYARANVVVQLSFAECYSAVYVEAMTARKPLIVSDRDFSRAICKDAALYVDPTSPLEIAQAISTVASDSRLRERLISAGDTAVSSRLLTSQAQWVQQKEMFRDLLGNPKPTLKSSSSTLGD